MSQSECQRIRTIKRTIVLALVLATSLTSCASLNNSSAAGTISPNSAHAQPTDAQPTDAQATEAQKIETVASDPLKSVDLEDLASEVKPLWEISQDSVGRFPAVVNQTVVAFASKKPGDLSINGYDLNTGELKWSESASVGAIEPDENLHFQVVDREEGYVAFALPAVIPWGTEAYDYRVLVLDADDGKFVFSSVASGPLIVNRCVQGAVCFWNLFLSEDSNRFTVHYLDGKREAFKYLNQLGDKDSLSSRVLDNDATLREFWDGTSEFEFENPDNGETKSLKWSQVFPENTGQTDWKVPVVNRYDTRWVVSSPYQPLVQGVRSFDVPEDASTAHNVTFSYDWNTGQATWIKEGLFDCLRTSEVLCSGGDRMKTEENQYSSGSPVKLQRLNPDTGNALWERSVSGLEVNPDSEHRLGLVDGLGFYRTQGEARVLDTVTGEDLVIDASARFPCLQKAKAFKYHEWGVPHNDEVKHQVGTTVGQCDVNGNLDEKAPYSKMLALAGTTNQEETVSVIATKGKIVAFSLDDLD